jgi:hypothetical protein
MKVKNTIAISMETFGDAIPIRASFLQESKGGHIQYFANSTLSKTSIGPPVIPGWAFSISV